MLGEAEDVAAQPLGMSLADLVEDVGIHHRRAGEQALGRGQVFEVAVEEEAQEALGDPGEDGFFAEDVEREEHVDDRVARDDPFVGARQHRRVGGVGVHDEF